MQEYHYNLVLFKEIKRFWEYRDQVGMFAMFTNLFGNVIIFMPFGFFMPMASKYRSLFSTVFYSFGLSLCVETFQLVTKVGSFDAVSYTHLDVYKRQGRDSGKESIYDDIN